MVVVACRISLPVLTTRALRKVRRGTAGSTKIREYFIDMLHKMHNSYRIYKNSPILISGQKKVYFIRFTFNFTEFLHSCSVFCW